VQSKKFEWKVSCKCFLFFYSSIGLVKGKDDIPNGSTQGCLYLYIITTNMEIFILWL